MLYLGTREIVQYSLCKHEDLNLVPTHVKKLGMVTNCVFIIPVLRRQRQLDPWGSLSSRFHQRSDLGASERPCLSQQGHQRLTSELHTHT